MNLNRTIHRDQLVEQLKWRYATKQFDPQRKIHPADWAALEESLLLTPSSFGLQPWKFVVVTDPALREKLVPVSWGQRQVADASHLVVFAIKKNLGPVQWLIPMPPSKRCGFPKNRCSCRSKTANTH